MSASEGYLNAITRLGEAKAQAQAEAARQNGQIWGNTISNIGQMVAQYPEQQAKLKEIANRADLTNLEWQREQRAAATEQRQVSAQQQASQVLGQIQKTPDGLWDTNDLMQKLTPTGLDPQHIESLTTGFEKMNDMTLAQRKRQEEGNADLAHGLLSIYTKDEPITSDSLSFNAEALKGIGGLNDADAQAIHDMGAKVPAGTDLRPLLKSIEQKKKEYQPHYVSSPEGAGVLDTTTGTMIQAATPKTPKTPEEVLFDSLNPNSKTKDISAAAVQKKADDAAAAIRNKPLTPYEQSEQANSDRNFKLATQRYNLAVKNSDKPAASKASVDLIDTVIAHPELWNQLTPTQKGALAQGLDAKGFSGFAAKEPAAMETRLASSKAVLQTGADMVKLIKENAGELGPLMGRYNSVADFVGNPPPKFKELAGLIESYSLANMGVHGMRSANASEAIKQTIGEGKQTPESMIATITGLNGFAGHLLQNEGRDVPGAAPPAATVPANVSGLLKSQKPGEYTLSDGHTYRRAADGTISVIK